MRIRSLDIFRGFAIFLMIIWHTLNNWIAPESFWFKIAIGQWIDVIGINPFVITAGVGFAISWELNRRKGLSTKQLHIKAITKTMIMAGFSLGYNLTAIFIHGYSWKNLWFWYILQTLVICRLIMQLLIHLKPKVNFIIAMGIITLTPFIISALTSTQNFLLSKEILYHILFNPLDADSPLFFFPYYILGVLFGQTIVKMKLENDPKKNSQETIMHYKKQIKNWIILGFILTVIGILTGLHEVQNNFGLNYISLLEEKSIFYDSTGYVFLINSSYAWILFTMGWQTVVLTLLFYFLDFRPKIQAAQIKYKNKQKKRGFFELFGLYSLSIYLTHYIFFVHQFHFQAEIILIPAFSIAMIIWVIFYLNDKYLKGKLSFEYGIRLGATQLHEAIMSFSHKKAIKRQIISTMNA